VESVEPDTIQRARACARCGYNLYKQPREGVCPECGHAYKRRTHDAIPKNPRRQAPPLRRLQRRFETHLRWVVVCWGVCALALLAVFYFSAGWKLWVVTIAGMLGTAFFHYSAVLNLRGTKAKIEAVDAANDHPQD
jgi:ribosomal protein L37E